MVELLSFLWTGNEDIHLVRGKSPAVVLADRLRVGSRQTANSTGTIQSLADFRNDNPNAECTFKPTFKAALNPATNEYEGFGIRVNALTGEINAGANPAPQPLYNFTILARLAVDKNNPASSSKQAYLRVHLHNYVAKAWLTPSPLNIPRDSTVFSLSVYAQYDDKTIAEQSTFAADSKVAEWSSNPPDKVRDPSGFISLDASDGDGVAVTIMARLVSELGDQNGGDVTAIGVVFPYDFPEVAHLIAN